MIKNLVRDKQIIIKCAKCGSRIFDIVADFNTLKESCPIRLKCYQCNAMNLIRIFKDHILVDVIDFT